MTRDSLQTDGPVVVAIDHGICEITMEKREVNALNPAMIAALDSALDR